MRTPIVKVSGASLKEAARIVRGGGLVIYPTDTVYGLGCDPVNSSAVQRLLEVKGRENKPLPILIGSIQDAEGLAELPTVARRMAEKYWPGALTLVLRSKVRLPEVGLGTVGLRVPKHRVALELIRLCGGCLVGTSANITGRPPALTAEDAADQLGGKVDLILDGGKAPLSLSSTVLDLSEDRARVLRAGPIDADELLRFVDVK